MAHTAGDTEQFKWPGTSGLSTYWFSARSMKKITFHSLKPRISRTEKITSLMTSCLLGLASHCDLCIHPGGEISMSGMIIVGPCVCECACMLLCVHMYISVLKNPIILSTDASKTICSNFPFCYDLRQLQHSIYFNSKCLHLTLSEKLLLFVIYEPMVLYKSPTF